MLKLTFFENQVAVCPSKIIFDKNILYAKLTKNIYIQAGMSVIMSIIIMYTYPRYKYKTIN